MSRNCLSAVPRARYCTIRPRTVRVGARVGPHAVQVAWPGRVGALGGGSVDDELGFAAEHWRTTALPSMPSPRLMGASGLWVIPPYLVPARAASARWWPNAACPLRTWPQAGQDRPARHGRTVLRRRPGAGGQPARPGGPRFRAPHGTAAGGAALDCDDGAGVGPRRAGLDRRLRHPADRLSCRVPAHWPGR
jgi:hypothetical protein